MKKRVRLLVPSRESAVFFFCKNNRRIRYRNVMVMESLLKVFGDTDSYVHPVCFMESGERFWNEAQRWDTYEFNESDNL